MSGTVAVLCVVQLIVLIVGYTMLARDEEGQLFGPERRGR